MLEPFGDHEKGLGSDQSVSDTARRIIVLRSARMHPMKSSQIVVKNEEQPCILISFSNNAEGESPTKKRQSAPKRTASSTVVQLSFWSQRPMRPRKLSIAKGRPLPSVHV